MKLFKQITIIILLFSCKTLSIEEKAKDIVKENQAIISKIENENINQINKKEIKKQFLKNNDYIIELNKKLSKTILEKSELQKSNKELKEKLSKYNFIYKLRVFIYGFVAGIIAYLFLSLLLFFLKMYIKL